MLTIVWNQHAHRLADHLLRAVTEQPLGGSIPGRDDAVQILADDGVVARIDNRCQSQGVALHAVRTHQVAGDLRRADDSARRIADRRHGQRNRNQGAILSLPKGLEMIDGFASTDGLQDVVFLELARSAGTMSRIDCPTISDAAYPNSLSAAGFHVTTVPSRVLLMIASSLVATMAAKWASRSNRFATVRSRATALRDRRRIGRKATLSQCAIWG